MLKKRSCAVVFLVIFSLCICISIYCTENCRSQADDSTPIYPEYDFIERHTDFNLMKNPSGISFRQLITYRQVLAGIGLNPDLPVRSERVPSELGAAPTCYNGFVLLALVDFSPETIERYYAMVAYPEYLRFSRAKFPCWKLGEVTNRLFLTKDEIVAHGILNYMYFHIDDKLLCYVNPGVFVQAKAYFWMRYGDMVEVLPSGDIPLVDHPAAYRYYAE